MVAGVDLGGSSSDRHGELPAMSSGLRPTYIERCALLSGDYLASDLAWLELDLTFAPCETCLDGLLEVRSSCGAAVLRTAKCPSAIDVDVAADMHSAGEGGVR